jgi:hypothetical protein
MPLAAIAAERPGILKSRLAKSTIVLLESGKRLSAMQG